MRVTHRLYLAAFPSVLGVFAVAALAYWGQFARAVPESILLIAAVAALSTMAMSWINVRYVAERVERLARLSAVRRSRNRPQDELDTIEDVVSGLKAAISSEQLARRDDKAAIELLRGQYAHELATVTAAAIRRLDDIQLPLHILLENHFGELNENQEEMLAAARAAAEAIDLDFETLQEIARLDLGEIMLRNDRVFVADLLLAILPTIKAIAAARDVTITCDIAPLVPPIVGDGSRIQRALLSLIAAAVSSYPAHTQVNLSLTAENESVGLSLNPAAPLPASVQLLLARRTIACGGGSLVEAGGVLNIRLGNPIAASI